MKLKEIARIIDSQPSSLLETIRRERPYRTPKGYLRWDVISAILALAIEGRNQHQDWASHLHSCKSALWLVQDAPVYCITPSLFQAFDQSDVLDQKELFAQIGPPLPTFMLLFPQGMLTTPTGTHLDWAIVHLADRNNPHWSTGEAFGLKIPYVQHDHERNFHWSGIDNEETVWFSGSGISRTGEIIHSDGDIGANPVDEIDRQFLARMRSLALQCLLAITYAPELLEEPEALSRSNGKTKGNGRQQAQQVRHPRWLGKSYKKKRQSYSVVERSSPRGHWRKRHQRRVVVGEGRIGREWRWFEPTWVGD